LLEECLLEQQAERKRSPLGGLIVALGALAVLFVLVIWAVRTISDNQRWDDCLASLEAEPGIIISSARRVDGQYVFTGLRDPLATDPADIFAGHGVRSHRVEARWEPYESHALEMAQARARLLETIHIEFERHAAILEASQPTVRRMIGLLEAIDRTAEILDMNVRVLTTGYANSGEADAVALNDARTRAVREFFTASFAGSRLLFAESGETSDPSDAEPSVRLHAEFVGLDSAR